MFTRPPAPATAIPVRAIIDLLVRWLQFIEDCRRYSIDELNISQALQPHPCASPLLAKHVQFKLMTEVFRALHHNCPCHCHWHPLRECPVVRLKHAGAGTLSNGGD